MTAGSTERVIVIAGRHGGLADAIADGLNAKGVTVAIADVTAGEILVRSHMDRSDDFRTTGYGEAGGAGADRQVARLLHLVGRVDGLVHLMPASTPSGTHATGPDPVGSSFHSALALILAAYSGWMRDNGGCITNVLGAHRYEPDDTSGTVVHASVDDALVLALTRELAAELAGLVDVNAIVVGPVDTTLEVLLGDSIRRPIPMEPRANEIDTITKAVIDFQTSARGSHNGEVLVLDLA